MAPATENAGIAKTDLNCTQGQMSDVPSITNDDSEPPAKNNLTEMNLLLKAATRSRKLRKEAMADLLEATPMLIKAITTGSGQGQRIERLLWSTWSGQHKVGLCDDLTGLDPHLAQSALAMLAARAHMGGDADPLIKTIIEETGTKPPKGFLI